MKLFPDRHNSAQRRKILDDLFTGMRNSGVKAQSGKVWGHHMIRTITLGSCVSVQGIFVRAFGDGRITIRDGDKTFVGRPVQLGVPAGASLSF